MPLCPSCKTFYVEEPCPTCENYRKGSKTRVEMKESMTTDAERKKSASTESEGLDDFFGSSARNVGDVDILTGRRKTKEALVTTPWHREEEIRSINQRKRGTGSQDQATSRDTSVHGEPSRPPIIQKSPITRSSSSSSTLPRRPPRIDSSLFNPLPATSSKKTQKTRAGQKQTKSSSLLDEGRLTRDQSRQPLRPPERPLGRRSEEVNVSVERRPRDPKLQPPASSRISHANKSVTKPTPPTSRPLVSPSSTTKESQARSPKKDAVPSRKVMEGTASTGQETDIPKWLLATKTESSLEAGRRPKSKIPRSSDAMRPQRHQSKGRSIEDQKERKLSKVEPKKRKGLMKFLRRKLLRRGRGDSSGVPVQAQKVNLAATHVKAGGLTLPRWLVGEKIEEPPSIVPTSSSPSGPSGSVMSESQPTSRPLDTDGSSGSAVPIGQSPRSEPKPDLSTRSEYPTLVDRESPRIIDDTLLELERKFKNDMPQMPVMSSTIEPLDAEPERLDLNQGLSIPSSAPLSPSLTTTDDVESSLPMNDEFGDFDDFDLEEFAAQVIAQLEAPDIRETEHRLDPQSLDTLESLAAEFLRDTAGMDSVVKTEVVRHDSVTSLALNPKYSQELKEIPGFDEEEEEQRLIVPDDARRTSLSSSSSMTSPSTSTSSDRLIATPSRVTKVEREARASSAIPLRKISSEMTRKISTSSQSQISERPAPMERPSLESSVSLEVPPTTAPPPSASTELSYQRSRHPSPVTTDSPVDYSDRPVVIAVEDLVKTYKLESGKEHRVLLGIQMEIYQGEWISIVGPSGSGKSSLLNILGGLDSPTVGSVYILGKDITKMSDRELSQYRLKTVGFVFQFFNLVPELSAVENIEFPQRLLGIDRKKARKRAEELLDWIGLWDVKDQRVDLLSGGEQQRVAICVALANDPPIILMDEPTGNLDKANTELVLDIFDRLNRDMGKTLVCVTHDLEVAARGHRIFSIVNGKIIEGKAIVD